MRLVLGIGDAGVAHTIYDDGLSCAGPAIRTDKIGRGLYNILHWDGSIRSGLGSEVEHLSFLLYREDGLQPWSTPPEVFSIHG